MISYFQIDFKCFVQDFVWREGDERSKRKRIPFWAGGVRAVEVRTVPYPTVMATILQY